LLSTPKFKHIQKEIGEILLKYDIAFEDKTQPNFNVAINDFTFFKKFE
jgi:hypothetical protein